MVDLAELRSYLAAHSGWKGVRQAARAQLVQRLQAGWRGGWARDRRQDRWTLVEPQWWIDRQGPMQLLTAEEEVRLLDQ